VRVAYEAPGFWAPFLRRVTVETLQGDDAYCVQHMADVFRGRVPCSAAAPLAPAGRVQQLRAYISGLRTK
jgi:hypothetical protein